MNKQRREKIGKLKARIQSTQTELKQISSELSSILNEEQDAFDNMPEGLQSSYRGMCSEDAIDNMEEASEKLDEVIELLCDIVQNREYIIRKYSEREINQIEATGSQPVTYGSEWKIISNESKFSLGGKENNKYDDIWRIQKNRNVS